MVSIANESFGCVIERLWYLLEGILTQPVCARRALRLCAVRVLALALGVSRRKRGLIGYLACDRGRDFKNSALNC
jgi:hypothetical protein